jgi:phytoene synthase
VGEDLAKGGRIYLPVNDMMRFQYSERDLVGKVYDGRFLALMSYEAERADHLFKEAENLLPEIDRKALVPAQIMADIYRHLLEKMRSGKFKVFDRRYSVSKARKLAILSKYLLAAGRAN